MSIKCILSKYLSTLYISKMYLSTNIKYILEIVLKY